MTDPVAASSSSRDISLIVTCAMEEEADPFLTDLVGAEQVFLLGESYRGPATFHSGSLKGVSTLVVTSGIGLTNAAVAMTAVLSALRPRLVVVAGTTGGLGPQVEINDVIVSSTATYHDADATEFGYAMGQIPRMPQDYTADEEAVTSARNAAGTDLTNSTVQVGPVSSSNSFVMARHVPQVREQFPYVLAVDMETAAVSQVCWEFGVPWVSIRAVSDLCDPNAGGVFHERAPRAYLTSHAAVMNFIDTIPQHQNQD